MTESHGRKAARGKEGDSEAVRLHREARGKWGVYPRVPLRNSRDLSLAYTPGVAEPVRRIAHAPDEVWELTSRGNLVAVVSDGTAVLGLGDVGPEAALPVMEGKALLFKRFAGIDAVPLVVRAPTSEVLVEIVRGLAPSFGGINLEDIAAPRCFAVEEELVGSLDIPVFHDDQHGTAIVVLAALLGALEVVGKALSDLRIVVAGAGAAGSAVAELLLAEGAGEVRILDRRGILSPKRGDLDAYKRRLAERTNPGGEEGGLAEALAGADVFVGVARGGLLSPEMVRTMRPPAIVFALSNPDPEILPDAARAAGAAIVATGRSDFPNQVNNVLAFPGVFRGALSVRARRVTPGMKRAAAHAIYAVARTEGISPETILPSVFHPDVVPRVAAAVARAALEEGVARLLRSPEEVEAEARRFAELGRRFGESAGE
ncbi:MAG: NADP-dependent malic enzyme [Brockia lithotrophica]|nr:NADP-dependent malic enzyme [Brockia lithotrophica]MBT9253690.1 NADP-dependent malic enzyme [Brockia lithotrophica]